MQAFSNMLRRLGGGGDEGRSGLLKPPGMSLSCKEYESPVCRPCKVYGYTETRRGASVSKLNSLHVALFIVPK